MKLIDEANRFGKEIAASKEYIRFLEAEKRYKEDKYARELIREFRRKQSILNYPDEFSDIFDLKEVRKELALLFEEIGNKQVINELNSALDEFLIFKANIYERIESYINIDEEVFSLNRHCSSCTRNCGGCKK